MGYAIADFALKRRSAMPAKKEGERKEKEEAGSLSSLGLPHLLSEERTKGLLPSLPTAKLSREDRDRHSDVHAKESPVLSSSS